MNGGIAIWDVADTRAPRPVARLDVPGFFYPDGYAKVVFWSFWQGRYLYLAAGDNGIVIVDAGDPTAPRIVRQVFVQPFLRAQHLAVIGNLMFVTQSDAARAVLLDVSDPTDPQPIRGRHRTASVVISTTLPVISQAVASAPLALIPGTRRPVACQR